MSAEYFSAGSSDYARYRPRYPEDWFDWLAIQYGKWSLAWDCACGSGHGVVGEYWPKERRMVEEGYVGVDFPF